MPGAEPGAHGSRQAHLPWSAALIKVAPVAVPAAVMAVLGVWGLARDSALANDEAATRIAAQLSLGQLYHLLRHIDAVHGLYYLLMQGWTVFGQSPALLRIPSLIGMIAAVALTSVLAIKLTRSGWVGFLAGMIMALTPAISYYAQTARSYALVVACVVGATLVLVAALRAESSGAATVWRWWAAYALLIALSGYLNEMALLVLAAHAVTVLLARYRPAVLRHWVSSGACGAALVSPLLLISATQHADVSWIPKPSLPSVGVLFHDYFGARYALPAAVVLCVIIAVLPLGGQQFRRDESAGATPGTASAAAPERPWWRQPGLSPQSVALPLLVVPAFLLIVESILGKSLFVDRYVLYGEVGAAVLAGAGLYRIGLWLGSATGRRWLIWIPGVIACVAAVLLQFGTQKYFRTPGSRLFDFTRPAAFIGTHARPHDGVLFFDTFFRKDRLLYPNEFGNTDDFGQALAPLQSHDFRGTDKPFAAVRPLILQHRRIWVVGMRPSSSLRTALLRQQSQVLTRNFTLVEQRHFRGIDVTLWLRRTR
jgi:mannosyltransferase